MEVTITAITEADSGGRDFLKADVVRTGDFEGDPVGNIRSFLIKLAAKNFSSNVIPSVLLGGMAMGILGKVEDTIGMATAASAAQLPRLLTAMQSVEGATSVVVNARYDSDQQSVIYQGGVWEGEDRTPTYRAEAQHVSQVDAATGEHLPKEFEALSGGDQYSVEGVLEPEAASKLEGVLIVAMQSVLAFAMNISWGDSDEVPAQSHLTVFTFGEKGYGIKLMLVNSLGKGLVVTADGRVEN